MRCSTSGEDSDQLSSTLFARAQAGDQDAWTALFQACYPKVRRVVGRKLDKDKRMRRLVDSTDIANLVLGNFALKADEFHFGSVAEVKSFLIKAALQSVSDEFRRRHTRKREPDRERPIGAGASDDELMLSSNDPSPSQVAGANETHRQLLDDVSLDDEGREIVARRAEHYEIKEISSRMRISTQKIQRFLRRLSKNYVN